MSKQRILISDKLPSESLKILSKTFDVDFKPGLSETEIIQIIGDYDALLVRSATIVSSKILEAAKNLKIVGRAGVGLDNIDLASAKINGITVVNSPGGNTVSTAEHTMALILSLARNIPYAHNSIQKKEWDRSRFLGLELSGKTLGIIGYGKIGKQVAKYAKVFGLNVIVNDPLISEDTLETEDIDMANINDLLEQSDIITLHVPKTPETDGFIDNSKIKKMKDGVLLINCARGGIINEKDLKEAVLTGKVAGAAIDVFSEEPINKKNPLIGVDRIITTPHIGAATNEAKLNVAIDVAMQVKDFLLNISESKNTF